MSTLAIIPARGGSKGVPRKNVRDLAGKPLIAWTIENARQARTVDRVVVSTDDRDRGGRARVWRRSGLAPGRLAGDTASSEAACCTRSSFWRKARAISRICWCSPMHVAAHGGGYRCHGAGAAGGRGRLGSGSGAVSLLLWRPGSGSDGGDQPRQARSSPPAAAIPRSSWRVARFTSCACLASRGKAPLLRQDRDARDAAGAAPGDRRAGRSRLPKCCCASANGRPPAPPCQTDRGRRARLRRRLHRQPGAGLRGWARGGPHHRGDGMGWHG